MRFKQAEYDAIISAGLRMLVLTRGMMTGAEIQAQILASMALIADVVETDEPPFIACITDTKVEIKMTRENRPSR